MLSPLQAEISPQTGTVSPKLPLGSHPSPPSLFCAWYLLSIATALCALSFCSPSRYHFLFLRSSSSWQLLRAKAPFLEGQAGPRTKTDPDPIFFSLCPPACRPWNCSLPSRIPSSLTFHSSLMDGEICSRGPGQGKARRRRQHGDVQWVSAGLGSGQHSDWGRVLSQCTRQVSPLTCRTDTLVTPPEEGTGQ